MRILSVTWLLLSRCHQECVGPVLHRVLSPKVANRNRCLFSVAVKWSSNRMERWSFLGPFNAILLGNHFLQFSHSLICQGKWYILRHSSCRKL